MNYIRHGKKVPRFVMSASLKQLWWALIDNVGKECLSGVSCPRAVLPTSEIFLNGKQNITVNYDIFGCHNFLYIPEDKIIPAGFLFKKILVQNWEQVFCFGLRQQQQIGFRSTCYQHGKLEYYLSIY
jgi:hypothetical protein